MKVVIDTSSLLSLVRYYLPFDKNRKLFDYIKEQVTKGNLIIIDAVLDECKVTSKQLVTKNLEYLTDKKFQKRYNLLIKTKDILPPAPKKFYNLMDDNFRTPLSRRLNQAEFEQEKKEYLTSADARMILFVLNEKHKNSDTDIVIVTEETEATNDRKTFKKIPAICKILGISVLTLPQLLEKYQEISIKFS